jgi:DNA mismatch repair protein MutS2
VFRVLASIHQALEWDKILSQLEECAVTEMGKLAARSCAPADRLEEVERRLRATDEAFKVERIRGGVPFAGIVDNRAALKRALIGAMLAPAELVSIAATIDGGRRLRRLLSEFHEDHDCPLLAHLAAQLSDHRALSEAIRSALDEQGYVLDQASVELTRIRHEMRAAESRVREKLEQMIRSSTMQKMLQEVLITIRNERFVLPVKADYRAAVNGIVHDQSASGATLFIEPEAVVQLNNKVKELKLREEREIEIILYRLSGLVATHAADLEIDADVLGQLDFVFACAKLAKRHKASLPLMNDRGYVRIRKGRHPMLDAGRVVPLDIRLGDEYRGIIITGPNTGGKTVALKTVGLLSVMAMSGLFVPAEDGTELSVFNGIFADIGDEQSIEQNLSTFSAHMSNMIRILAGVRENSLVLLDEMGAGTDPTEGAALAVALLDELLRRGCLLIATTHFSSLKAYAQEKEGLVNASVEFDTVSLQPTYRLLIGVPGRSNALIIAERLGLPASILATAKRQLPEDELRVERMLAALEEQRLRLERDQTEVATWRHQLQQRQQAVEQEQQQLRTEREQRVERAKEEAKRIVQQARAEAEQVIAELRQRLHVANADTKEHELIEARHRLKTLGERLEPNSTVDSAPQKAELQIGDEVKIVHLNQKGTVVELVNDKEVFVQIGSMRSRVKRSSLQWMGPAKSASATKPSVAIPPTLQRTNRSISLELDVRGYALDDAIMAVDQYLSEVVLAGFAQVTIIHGVGTGVLRKGIQQHVKNHRAVKSHRTGRYGEGDLGVTVVEMK